MQDVTKILRRLNIEESGKANRLAEPLLDTKLSTRTSHTTSSSIHTQKKKYVNDNKKIIRSSIE